MGTKACPKYIFKCLLLLVYKNLSRRDINTTTIFCLLKSHPNKYVEVTSVFQRNYIKKIHQNNVDVTSNEITSKKVSRNGVDFSPIKLSSIKLRRNDVNFLPIEITLKKYVDMMWKFIDVFFSTYPRNIDIESTSI